MMNIQQLKTATLALVTIGALGLSAPLMAQGMQLKVNIDRMAERLDLDAAQAEAISDLISAHREWAHNIEWQTADGEINPEAEAARQALQEEIRALLTPEQIEKFDALNVNAMPGGGQRRMVR